MVVARAEQNEGLQRLLEQGDRAGSRNAVRDEIVRLGEGYSIATEYTSFIVLENDSEYRRWKIDRKNALRLQGDRAAREKVKERLAKLRRDSQADLGPAQPPSKPAFETLASATPVMTNLRRAPASPPSESPRNSRRFDLDFSPGFGGGAIDPITGSVILAIGGVGLLARRRNQKQGERQGGESS